VFSDLVLMKYLAFGLMAALLLDATVVRMFLVPAVMKLLGDDCWWAPRWARRLQNRLGLGEMDIPDERKRPTLNGRPARPPVSAASLVAAAPRARHDPTHPGALEPRPVRELPTGAPTAPSRANTTRMQAMSSQPTDAKTARLSVPTNAAPGNQTAPGGERPADAHGPPNSPPRPPASPPPPPPAPTPSSGQTRAIPVPTNHPADNKNDPADPTAGLPVMRSDANDSEAATEQLKAGGQSDNGDNSRQRRRAGGGGAGVSAQELLRREGRL
jgi:trehalose monomycolate/heme transporter